MAWTSRGLRGSTLEEMINRTNEQYRDKHLALIQKVPTPITPIKIDKESRHITLAYFEKKSTVDYIGAVQGIPVCFDAKECKTDSFPLPSQNGKQRSRPVPERNPEGSGDTGFESGLKFWVDRENVFRYTNHSFKFNMVIW